MDDHAALLEAVAADPTADTPRLVYADWLDDHDRPREAEYLRAELDLARLPDGTPDAPPARARLWRAWAAVDADWRHAITQPRLMRANPTPFEAVWINYGLGRKRPAGSTYGWWPYGSVPDLPHEAFRGDFGYVIRGEAVALDHAEGLRGQHERMLADAAAAGIVLPEPFLRFMGNAELWHGFRSPTDCGFGHPSDYNPIRTGPEGEGVHVHFFSDSQSCVLWDLYVHPAGANCVIARDYDYFEPDPPDPDDPDPDTGPRAWFVAPSFEAFIYRVWTEDRVWFAEHGEPLRHGGEPPAVTAEMRAYLDHYRSNDAAPG